jgi:hypothetical protein
MVLHPPRPFSNVETSCTPFEWRANAGRWRWLILSALGAASNACGGRSDTALSDTSRVGLEGAAGSSGLPVTASRGGTGATETPVDQPPPPGNPPTQSMGGSGNLPAPTTQASACENPSAIGGGWLRCDNGMLHRAAAGACDSSLPRADLVTVPPEYTDNYADGGWTPACREDSDCNAGPYGHCEGTNAPDFGPYCAYGCVVDADCQTGQVCLCGEPVGQCMPASCATDADCGSGQLCADYTSTPGCGGVAFACQTASDECAAASDCGDKPYCTIPSIPLDGSEPAAGIEHRRTCSGPLCVIGRPFLIDGAESLALPEARTDWYSNAGPAATPCLPADASLRRELARAWTEQALMEHASIAAFARFSLQLLSLGAPADLVQRSSQAMQDEIGHARACFELARHYSGADVGPGSLPVDGALSASDLCSVVLGTIAEGCIGETLAALEAAEALAHCEEPAVRAVLERITIEESRHAELAWQLVAWALETGPGELKEQVRGAFAAAIASEALAPLRPSATDRELLRHGVVSSELRRALRERVLRDVIAPCAGVLLERAELAGTGVVQAHAHPRSLA